MLCAFWERASVNIQQEAGVEEADLLIAVTGSDD